MREVFRDAASSDGAILASFYCAVKLIWECVVSCVADLITR
jgi:hypothetical protein